ncbi:BSD domain-containing protein 1-B [Tribolium castaneum]|uniref:BSD domain-containing protein 1-like Protein n=1 Tax=Tribolium castaneum TaxID=7070 RepID=D6WQ18_TRICA|nr:PREDICTED: BSD domain-containing protein 1-B [Tribolium castaneum]EFA06908.1 BSD domain-containing protein 1-like Protein [Tribolium castaneum]|eukprot:XP_974260.1 PREDICTED: BSD domain-containing protein 1-B [Tribolium castaneum]
MAEQDDNWFGSWLNAAKDKSSKVLEFVKKDLEEFGTAVKNEASYVVSSTGNVIEKTFKLDTPDSTASSMKRSFSSFLGQMNTVLNPTPDDSDTEAILIGEDSETVPLTKLQKAIYELQKEDVTFTNDPEEALAKKFECWLEIIDDQLSEDRINKHLTSSTVLRNQYEKLVPDTVPHSLFWKRYLFKRALLEDEIAHQEAMEKKEKKEKAITVETVKWDQEDLAPYIELTEEEQIKLLQEYENEIKNKQDTKCKESKKEAPMSAIPDTCDTNSKVSNLEEEMKTSETKAINKVDSAISLETTSSNSSTDGDWEKIGDIDK